MDVTLLKDSMGMGSGGLRPPHGDNNNIINTTLHPDITQQQQHQREFYDHYAEEEDPTPSEMGVRASGSGLPFAYPDPSPVTSSSARGGLAPPSSFSTSYFASNNVRSSGGNSYYLNNSTTSLSLQQQQQQARQAAAAANAARVEEAKVLNRKLEAFERQLSKVRVLWAEVLHVCPEQHVLKSSRSACGTSLAERHTEEEYVAALMRPHIVTRSSDDTGISQSSPILCPPKHHSPLQQEGYAHERRVKEVAEGIRPILAAPCSDGSAANIYEYGHGTSFSSNMTIHPQLLLLPHPLLVPSYPLSSSDSYDTTREVCQRWVYALHGVGLRSPHEHLHYVEERSTASEAILIAMKGIGGHNEQQRQQVEDGAVVANKFREIAIRCATLLPRVGEDGQREGTTNGVLGYRADPSDGALDLPYPSADGNISALLLSSAMTGRPSPSLSLCSRYSHASLLCSPLGSEPTVNQMNFLQDEVRRLAAIRDARATVEEAIKVREGFVFYLQSLLSDFTLSEASADHNGGSASGGGIDGLNNDHRHNDGGSSLLRGFLDIEQGWRDGAAQLVERLERQIAFYETEGDLALRAGDQQESDNNNAKESMHSSPSYYSTTARSTTTAVVINAVQVAQQIHRIQREAAEAGNVAIAQQQQLQQQQQHQRRSVGALIANGRHRLTPHLNPRDNDQRQRKPSQQTALSVASEGAQRLGILTFEEAEAATQNLVNTLTTAADQTFSAPDGLPYAALPLSQTLQVNLSPPPLVVPPITLISANASSVDDAEEEEGKRNEDFVDYNSTAAVGSSFPNPVSNLVSTSPITMSSTKVNRMESNLLLVREQLGVLLHSRPPIGFASASGSAAGEVKSGGGGGGGGSSAIGPTITKASPIINTTAPTAIEKKKTTLGGASVGRRYGSGAGGASSSSSSSTSTPFNLLFSTSNANNVPYNLSYGTATNQPNALRKALKGALANVRRSSFDVVRAVEAWRSLLLQHPAIKEYNAAVYAAHQAAVYCSTPQSNTEEEEATLSSTMNRFCSDVLLSLMAGFDPVATVLTNTAQSLAFSSSSSSLSLPSTPPFVVPVFLWRGSSYVARMSSDLSFLVPFLRPLKERGEFIEKMIKTVRPFVLKPLIMNGVNGTTNSSTSNNYKAYLNNNDATSAGGGGGYVGAYSDSEGGGELRLQPGDFAAEFCRLRKAQCYILKQLIKTTERGFFLREAVAAALGEALELCDPEGNPFLNPSRRFPNYSTLAVARAVYNDEGGAGGHFGGGTIGPYSSVNTNPNNPTSQSPSGGQSFISPLLAFFSAAHRYAVLKRLESERMRELYGGVGTALLLASSEGYSLSSNEAANVISALNSYSFYGNDPTAASQHNTKSNGLPDILRSGSNNSVRAYFRGSDEASARREVDPSTYAWAESCVLAELLAMGRQLSLSGGLLDHRTSRSNTLRLLSRLVDVLMNERLSSALPLHEHITSLARKIAKVTKKASRKSLIATLPNQAEDREGMKPFLAFASDSSRRTSAASGFIAHSDDATAAARKAALSGGETDDEGEEELDAVGSHDAPLRSYSFERLNRYGTVLRQKEALARLELREEARRASLSAKLNNKKRKTGQDEAINTAAPTIMGHGINRFSTSSFPSLSRAGTFVGGGGGGGGVGISGTQQQQQAEEDAAAEAAAAILATNTTSKGVYVRPEVMASVEAECAGITFSSGVADIQYDMVSMYEKFMINPSGDRGGGGDAEGGAGGSLADDGDRQSLLLVLRRMGKSDPTLAAHLRVINARRHQTAASTANGKHNNTNTNKLASRGNKAAAAQRYNGGGGEVADESMLAAAAAAVGLGSLPKSSGLNNKSSLGVGTSAPPTAIPTPSFITNNTLLALGRIVRFAKRQFDMMETDEDRDDFADIITCQALWRGRQARRYTRALRTLHDAARSIQGVRKCREAATQLADKRLQHRSAIKIQSLVRGVLARRAVAMLILVIKAATTIQRYYRGYKSRKEATLRRQLVSSVVKIQKSFRGYEERRAAEQYKGLIYNNAAIAIQRMWRGGALRASGAASPSMIKAATKIQAFWRGVSARRHVARLKSLHNKATAINSLVKGGHERRTVVRERVEAREQARARGLEAVEAAAKAAEEAIPEVFELPKGSRYRQL